MYGPVNAQTQKIIQNVSVKCFQYYKIIYANQFVYSIAQANGTLLAINRLKDLIKAVDTSIKQLRVEGEFRKKFLNIVQLAKSPFVQMMMANFNVDPKILDTVFDALLYDKQVADIVETIANIFECFAVDRFVGVESEEELEDMAKVLNQKKLFYAGIFFGNDGYDRNKEFSYKIRMDTDNTPITLENRNRFWFPGPNGNFELNMQYHRGFIQIQHILDQAIIKTVVEAENKIQEKEWLRTSSTTTTTTTTTQSPIIAIVSSDSDSESENTSTDEDSISTTPENETSEMTTNKNITLPRTTDKTTQRNSESTVPTVPPKPSTTKSAVPSITTNGTLSSTKSPDFSTPKLVRKKRQFDFLNSVLGQSGNEANGSNFIGIEHGNMRFFTKQFPYPKYHEDNFLTGIYMAQCIQLVFFFALIVQVSSAVRNRIWMKESGNSTVSGILND